MLTGILPHQRIQPPKMATGKIASAPCWAIYLYGLLILFGFPMKIKTVITNHNNNCNLQRQDNLLKMLEY